MFWSFLLKRELPLITSHFLLALLLMIGHFMIIFWTDLMECFVSCIHCLYACLWAEIISTTSILWNIFFGNNDDFFVIQIIIFKVQFETDNLVACYFLLFLTRFSFGLCYHGTKKKLPSTDDDFKIFQNFLKLSFKLLTSCLNVRIFRKILIIYKWIVNQNNISFEYSIFI